MAGIESNKRVITAVTELGAAATAKAISELSSLSLQETIEAIDKLCEVAVLVPINSGVHGVVYQLACQSDVSESPRDKAQAESAYKRATDKVIHLLQTAQNGLTRQQLLSLVDASETTVDNVLAQLRRQCSISGGRGGPIKWDVQIKTASNIQLEIIRKESTPEPKMSTLNLVDGDFSCSIDSTGNVCLKLPNGMSVEIKKDWARELDRFLSGVQGVLRA